MLDDGRLKWRGLELVRRVSFRLVDVTRVVSRVTDAINSRETRERKLLDDTKRRAISTSCFPGMGREERNDLHV